MPYNLDRWGSRVPGSGREQRRRGRERGDRGNTRGSGNQGQRGQERPLMRSVPLYTDVGFPSRDKDFSYTLQPATPHPGLVFDKFIDTWLIDANGRCTTQKPGTDRNDSKELKFGSKRAWLKETITRYEGAINVIQKGLTAALDRQKQLIKVLGGKDIEMATDWRFVSGLGNGHPFETGFIWHRTLGVPYLPGSAVKGLMRAWADPDKGWGDAAKWKDVKHLFGDTGDDGAGTLIVFDALPLSPPAIDVDIMNPHYAKYYAGDKDANGRTIPPADYLSPTPIFFLAVAVSQSFQFVLAPRCQKKANAENDVALGCDLLEEALSTLGAGGKTAVGYGYFGPGEDAKCAKE